MKIKDYPFSDKDTTALISRIEKVYTNIRCTISAISIVTSLRTVIIMKVMTLYAETALGQVDGLNVFHDFWYSKQCTKLRQTSFKSFITAIQTFRSAFALSIFLKTHNKHRYVATGVAVLIMIVSGIQLDQMIRLASGTIFQQSL